MKSLHIPMSREELNSIKEDTLLAVEIKDAKKSAGENSVLLSQSRSLYKDCKITRKRLKEEYVIDKIYKKLICYILS